MSVARITAKGQITIPFEIRKRLGLKDGDKIVFMEKDDSIVILNSNRLAWKELQEAFAGAAEEVGFKVEQDVIDYCREIRNEIREERNGHNV